MIEVRINNQKDKKLYEKVQLYLNIIESLYKIKIQENIIINYSNIEDKSAQNNFKRIEIPILDDERTMDWITVHEIAHFLFGKQLQIKNDSNLWIAEGGASFTADIVLLIAAIDSIEDVYNELKKSLLKFEVFLGTGNYYQLALHGGRLVFHCLYYLEGGDTFIHILQKILTTSDCNENTFLDITLFNEESIELINKFIQFDGFTKHINNKNLLRKSKKCLERFSFLPIQKHLYECLANIKVCLNSERFSLFLLENKVYRSIFNEGVGFSFYFSKGQGICGQAVLNKKPVFTNSAKYDKRSLCRYRDSTTAYNTESLLAYPVIQKGKVIAVYELLNKTTDYNESDIQYIKKIFHEEKIEKQIAFFRSKVSLYGKDFF